MDDPGNAQVDIAQRKANSIDPGMLYREVLGRLKVELAPMMQPDVLSSSAGNSLLQSAAASTAGQKSF
jgi:hypothetical protein